MARWAEDRLLAGPDLRRGKASRRRLLEEKRVSEEAIEAAQAAFAWKTSA